MRAAEQQGLLLRQLAALRHRGLSQDEALALVAAGLPAGSLADEVKLARRALAAGSAEAPTEAPMMRLLAQGEGPVTALEQAARAIDCRLATEDALAMTRFYGLVFGVAPMLVMGLVSWLLPDVSLWPSSGRAGMLIIAFMASVGQWLGPALAIVGLVALTRLTSAHGAGMRAFALAGSVMSAAAAGGDPVQELTDPVMRAHFAARRAQVGAARAADELADELMADGERFQLLFRELVPVGALGVALVCLLPVGLVFASIVFVMARMA